MWRHVKHVVTCGPHVVHMFEWCIHMTPPCIVGMTHVLNIRPHVQLGITRASADVAHVPHVVHM